MNPDKIQREFSDDFFSRSNQFMRDFSCKFDLVYSFLKGFILFVFFILIGSSFIQYFFVSLIFWDFFIKVRWIIRI